MCIHVTSVHIILLDTPCTGAGLSDHGKRSLDVKYQGKPRCGPSCYPPCATRPDTIKESIWDAKWGSTIGSGMLRAATICSGATILQVSIIRMKVYQIQDLLHYCNDTTIYSGPPPPTINMQWFHVGTIFAEAKPSIQLQFKINRQTISNQGPIYYHLL